MQACYGETMYVIMKYEIKIYREMHVSFTNKTHVDVMFVGI